METLTVILIGAAALGLWKESSKKSHPKSPAKTPPAVSSQKVPPDQPEKTGYGMVGRWVEDEGEVEEEIPFREETPEEIAQPEDALSVPPELDWLKAHIGSENPRLSPEDRDRVTLALAHASEETGLPLSFLTAVVQVESNFNPLDQSPSGAAGLGQLMPGTARDLGVANPLDPFENALGAATYLKRMLDQYRADPEVERLTLASYRIGPGAVQRGLADREALLGQPVLVSYFSRFDAAYNRLP